MGEWVPYLVDISARVSSLERLSLPLGRDGSDSERMAVS